MYNKNGENMKKGFTLAELLGVTVLLALITAVAYPALFKIFNDKEEERENEKIELISSAAINYTKSNINDYPFKEGQSACVFLQTLVDKNLIPFEIDETLSNRIVQIKMNVNQKYTAELLEKGETCQAYNTTSYQINTCTKDASAVRYTLKDDRTLYYVNNRLVKQIDFISGKNKSDLAGFQIQMNNYDSLNNRLKYQSGITSQIDKNESYFEMKVTFDMNTFTDFTEEQKKALQNAPIFYHDNELEHTCNG